MTEAIVITESDLSKVEDSVFNASQLQQILTKTPERYKKKRPGKGGQTWEYVEVGYVQKVLNLMFGFNWDFEIVDEKIIHGEVVVRGRLTVRSGDKQVVKTQYGNKDIICKRGTETPLSIGNDMKAAASDALKKCAQALGIAQDVYNPENFKAANVKSDDEMHQDLEYEFEQHKADLKESTVKNVTRILTNKETSNYTKAWKQIQSEISK